MGEARRRKLAGDTDPNPNYRKSKKITRKQIQEIAEEFMGVSFIDMNYAQRLAVIRANKERLEGV